MLKTVKNIIQLMSEYIVAGIKNKIFGYSGFWADIFNLNMIFTVGLHACYSYSTTNKYLVLHYKSIYNNFEFTVLDILDQMIMNISLKWSIISIEARLF